MIKIIHILLIFITSSFTSQASPSHNKAIELLQEAEDYLRVKPSHTLKLLKQIKNLSKQPDKVIIRWHIIRARASISTNNLSIIEASLEQVMMFQNHPYFIQQLPTILRTSGIWLRKSGYFEQADSLFNCALQLTKNLQIRLYIKNSQGLVARHLGHYVKAKHLFLEAKRLSTKLGSQKFSATAENNLGSVAIDLGKLAEAEQHYRTALVGYQKTAKRSGNVTAGINLLFVFLLQDQLLNYQRLYPPIKTLSEAFPNKSKQAFLFWINWAFKAKMGEKINEETREKLQDSFIKLESRQVQSLIKKYLAQPLSINLVLPPQPPLKQLNFPWLSDIQKCKWKPKKDK
ncbi:tetratricopeptide repeat protein [Pseudoalteromonas denitrificans]|uniref:Uncharacterized protein n=1 Tax=Pseudoalteromonas denitrificans DSM 6059 TaxID=1123010 RepID=A0A1I1PSL0_9GAMM|nr:tetratricopeptide repeat protein [Pseudoalteromonas denitrificans]SFD12809.1 hypothetical protein SAMN02745724_03581 [Pseudoalteromonas denitrificans DSM 6059]